MLVGREKPLGINLTARRGIGLIAERNHFQHAIGHEREHCGEYREARRNSKPQKHKITILQPGREKAGATRRYEPSLLNYRYSTDFFRSRKSMLLSSISVV